ncbi:DUF1326 domain-containing protein [Marinibaculum pumilum]|uniref:DUF1326 domain-containing protein n=1 Tax=Marinibaculum pumilum TaxID=1766165 RepID=A0ABV7L9A9_9PROT
MSWQIRGEYMETCNCAYLCPCIFTNLTARPTEGECKAAVAMRIDAGEKDGTDLSGTAFMMMIMSPGPMADGDMTVGLIIDDAASAAQVQAVTEIASGQAGGPMAALAPLVGTFAGIERRPVRLEGEGMSRRATAGELVEQSCTGVAGGARPEEPLHIGNTAHFANDRLALARNGQSRFDAFGIRWDDASGDRNGHFAPFAWAG